LKRESTRSVHGTETIDRETGSVITLIQQTATPVVQPASTTHTQFLKEERRKAGISDTLIRVSVGIEDPEDLIEDFDQALSRLR
jgi:O-acetylhomoserine (thiol)-lyase